MNRLEGSVPGAGFSTMPFICFEAAVKPRPPSRPGRRCRTCAPRRGARAPPPPHCRPPRHRRRSAWARAGGRRVHQHVRQHHREGLVADDVARAPDRVAEARAATSAARSSSRPDSGSSVSRMSARIAVLALGLQSCVSSSIWRGRSSPRCRPGRVRGSTTICSIPAARASATTWAMIGRSNTLSRFFGVDLGRGQHCACPGPATGSTALRTRFMGDVT